MVPEALREDFRLLIDEQHYLPAEKAVVKQVDALYAYLKCLEEISAGNTEFTLVMARLEKNAERSSQPRNEIFPGGIYPKL